MLGGNRGVQAAQRGADPIQKKLTSGNLELCSSKWDLCGNVPNHRWIFQRKEAKVSFNNASAIF